MSSRRSRRSSRLKVHLLYCGSTSFSLLRFSVKENKESSLDAQNQLREEILGKLEETNRNIDQVGILKTIHL